MKKPDSHSLPSSPPYRTAASPRLRVPFFCVGPSKTKQSFKDECDINVLMQRYQATGILPAGSAIPRYADVSELDYQLAQDTVATANSMFSALPSGLRARFDNDPAKLLGFLEDPKNHAEAFSLGLTKSAGSSAEPATPPPAPAEAPKGA